MIVEPLDLHETDRDLLLARLFFSFHLFVLLPGTTSVNMLLVYLLGIQSGGLLSVLELLFGHIMLPDRLTRSIKVVLRFLVGLV